MGVESRLEIQQANEYIEFEVYSGTFSRHCGFLKPNWEQYRWKTKEDRPEVTTTAEEYQTRENSKKS